LRRKRDIQRSVQKIYIYKKYKEMKKRSRERKRKEKKRKRKENEQRRHSNNKDNFKKMKKGDP
jgi:hypothetical protein